MQPWLRNEHWAVYITPREEDGEQVWAWSLYGSHREAPLVEAATFGLVVKGWWRRFWVRPLMRHVVEQAQDGPRHGTVTWMADARGLAVRLEMVLHKTLPLVRWQVHWIYEGPTRLAVQKVILMDVGPFMRVKRARGFGPGYIPGDFLQRTRPPRGQPGALRLHPSPAALALVAPPWPGEDAGHIYSAEHPYTRPEGRAATFPLPKAQGPEFAFAARWGWLWDARHARGLALAGEGQAPFPPIVEAHLHPLHPALRLTYMPRRFPWPPGHHEESPWAGLLLFEGPEAEARRIFREHMALLDDPAWDEAERALHTAPTEATARE